MFFLRISMVMVIYTFIQNGETAGTSSSKTNDDDVAVEYNLIMSIDTGYSDRLFKKVSKLKNIVSQRDVTKNKLSDARAKVHKDLLCSYVFTCQFYMIMVKKLINETSETFLKVAFQNEFVNQTDFQEQIVKMFFVLKHLGTINSLEPLWMVYAYLECIKTIEPSVESIKNYELTIYDDRTIGWELEDFISKNKCNRNNTYNYQYKTSIYYENEKVSFVDKNLVKGIFEKITESARERFSEIKQILSLDDSKLSFSINDLHIPRVILNNTDDFVDTLVKKIAEIKFTRWTHPPEIYKIRDYCYNNRKTFESAQKLVLNVSECGRMNFTLMKYIIANNALKYVLDVHSVLPENGPITIEVLDEWDLLSNTMMTKRTMLNYIKDIISLLKMDDDEDLKFVAGIFVSQKPDLCSYSDLFELIRYETKLKNILRKCTEVLFKIKLHGHESNEHPLTRADLDLSNKSERREILHALAKGHNIKVRDSDVNVYEGMLDLFVFKNYITKLFVGTQLDIAYSFFKFSENIYGKSKQYLNENN